ncbi:MAG: hypothetical protein JJ975_00585 [Bacteroidia bacterium]|nr:hypothetical protein [Bacteroidia bacterium]
MNRNKLSIVLGLALMIAFVASCDDVEPLNPNKSTPTYTDIDAYFADNEVSSETFQLTAETGGSFTTAKGSKITIPPYSFVTRTGQNVTGPVEFKFKEVFSNSDIIFSGVFPISHGHVLNSGGEFYTEAKSNGQKVLIRDGQPINIVIPAQAEDPGMMLFFGGEEENPDSMDWEVADVDTVQGDSMFGRNGFTFNSADKTYSIDTDSMGWGNIDAFDWTIKYFDCVFNLTGLDGLSGENTTAFAVFKDANAVWPVGVRGWGDITDNVITERHLGAVAMNLVVISVKDGELYYGLLDFTPEEGKSYDIEMKPTTKDDLDTLIRSFE